MQNHGREREDGIDQGKVSDGNDAEVKEKDGYTINDKQRGDTPQIHLGSLNRALNNLYIPFTGFQILIGHNQSLLSYYAFDSFP
jgi:hypothetical protein